MRSDSEDHTQNISEIELDRRSFRRKQTVKSVFVSCFSLLVLAAVIIFALSHSEGWARVQYTYFNPEFFVLSLPQVAKGFLLNLRVFGCALVIIPILASTLAIIRTTRSAVLFPLRVLAVAYTSLFRGLPLIILLYLIGFGIPTLGIFGRMEMWVLGLTAISLSYAAYVSEIIRAGIEAVHPSQRMAARSLGFTYGRTMRIVIFPQAVRKVIPALMNDFIALQKDVGLVSILGVVDAIRQAYKFTAVYFNYTSYIVAGLIFILTSLPFILLTDWYSRKVQRREQLQGAV